MTVKIKDLQAIQKDLPSTKVEDFNNIQIEIKQYLTTEKKMLIAEQVYGICAVDNNGFKIANHTLKDIMTDILIIKNYTDVKVQENFLAAYDLINSIGLNGFVTSKIPQAEIGELYEIINDKIYYERDKQECEKSLVGVVENFLVKLNDKIPGGEDLMALVGNVAGQLKEFSPEKLNFVQDFIKANNGVEASGDKIV